MIPCCCSTPSFSRTCVGVDSSVLLDDFTIDGFRPWGPDDNAAGNGVLQSYKLEALDGTTFFTTHLEWCIISEEWPVGGYVEVSCDIFGAERSSPQGKSIGRDFGDRLQIGKIGLIYSGYDFDFTNTWVPVTFVSNEFNQGRVFSSPGALLGHNFKIRAERPNATNDLTLSFYRDNVLLNSETGNLLAFIPNPLSVFVSSGRYTSEVFSGSPLDFDDRYGMDNFRIVRSW